MFNLAIDSKLRGCDLVALRADDVAPNWYAADRATIRHENGSTRPLRAGRSHTPGAGRLPGGEVGRRGNSCTLAGGRISRRRPPLCSASLPMDHRHLLGSAQLHNPFRAGPKPHLSANGDFTRGATFARTPAHRLCPGRDYVPCGYLSRSDRALMLSALDIGSLLVGHSRPQGARLNMLHSAPKLCRDGTVQRVLQRVLKEAK